MCSILSLSLILFSFVNIASSDIETYGNCPASRAADRLLWQYEVRRPSWRNFRQTAEAQYGPTSVVINCINVTSMGLDNSVATITSGGVGYNHVVFRFTSSPGGAIRSRVLAYGDVLA